MRLNLLVRAWEKTIYKNEREDVQIIYRTHMRLQILVIVDWLLGRIVEI